MDDLKWDIDEERKLIVEKYQKGREKILHQIRDDEDPEVKEISRIDRYGFIHDHLLPLKLTKFEAKVRTKEASRSEKWVKMIKQWDKHSTNFEKLRKRVYKGIPDAIRGEAWTKLMGVSQVKKEQEGRYQELLKFGLKYSKDIRQIDLDINRTFRNNVTFRDRYNSKQQQLFNVLVSYSVYNTEIGYTQGMSQIAALLLMYTSNEEDAFWSLDRLMSSDKYAMHGFFIDGFPKLKRFASHHDLILKKFLPKVYKHFKKFEIDSTMYTLKWFFQCFLDRVPFSLTLRIWDCFMLEGEMILTCMSYTLLKLHKKTILEKGMEDLISFLQIDLEKDFGYLDDQAIKELQISIQELKRYRMESPAQISSQDERPSKPFGILLQADNLSITTGYDDKSIAGSIILKTSDSVSLAQTSKTESDVAENDFENDTLNDIEVNDFCHLQRSFSLYDNVDTNESYEAAKRLSDQELNDIGFFKTSKDKIAFNEVKKNNTQKNCKIYGDVDNQNTQDNYRNLNMTPTNEFSDFVIINDYPDGSYSYNEGKFMETKKDFCDNQIKDKFISSFEKKQKESKINSPQTSEIKHVLQDWPDSQWVLIRSSRELFNTSQEIIDSTHSDSYAEDLSSNSLNLLQISEASELETNNLEQNFLKSNNLISDNSKNQPSSFLIRKTSIPRLKPKNLETNLNLDKSCEKNEYKLNHLKKNKSSIFSSSTSSIPRLSKKFSALSTNKSNEIKRNNLSHQHEMCSNINTDIKSKENITQISDNSTKLRIYVPFDSPKITPKEINKIKIKVNLPKTDNNIHNSYLPSIDS